MAEVHFPDQGTISATEILLSQIADHHDWPLQLRTQAKYSIPGAESSLVQAINTWARSRPSILQTWLEDENDIDQAETLTRNLYGIVGVLAAARIIDRKGGDVSDLVRAFALKRLTRLQGLEPLDVQNACYGGRIEILAADHLSKPYPRLLYKNVGARPEIRDRTEFRMLAAWMLETITRGVDAKPWMEDASSAIGNLVLELYKNTDDHALLDHAGNRANPSIRGIQARRHVLKKGHYEGIVEDYIPLARYFDQLTQSEDSDWLQLFELSVFDSGPGFAQTWTNRNYLELSQAEEQSAVIDCFSAGSSKQRSGYGQGLPHVVRILDELRGFIRVRTGRVSIYFDFATHRFNAEVPEFQGWTFDGSLAPAIGSVITILIPLRAF
jgi:hypothetical protein